MIVNYKSSSFTMAGAACIASLLSHVFWELGDGAHALAPGFMYTAGLAVPVLSAWLGILLRKWIHQTQLWVVIPLAVLAGFMLYKCASSPDFYTFTNRGRVCLAMLIMGYLIPESLLESFGAKGHWIPSILVFLAAALCYTCVEVVETRIPFIGSAEEYAPLPKAEARALATSLLQIAETAVLSISVFAAIAVSFSSVGLAVGNNRWVRLFLYVVFVLSFIKTLCFVLPVYWIVHGYCTLCLISSPVFIYLVVVTRRSIRKLRHKNESSWKEVFSI